MATGFDPSGRLPAVFTGNTGTSSFTDFLSVAAPELLPGRRALPPGFTADLTHGTTIVSLTYADGVIMAGDRRATMGNLVANRDIEKVYAADPYSLVGVAGTAGVGIELIRLYQVELEHYEKIEGTMLSLDGKANRLATMIRNNLPAAMQGLAVVPIYAGYDLDAADRTRAGRLFSFDVAGGIYEETGYDGIGSGSLFAKSALKKRYRPGMARDEAIRIAVESLYDAADDDTATGGPDPIRKIYPIIMSATADGAVRLTDEESGAVSEAVIAARRDQPGG